MPNTVVVFVVAVGGVAAAIAVLVNHGVAVAQGCDKM